MTNNPQPYPPPLGVLFGVVGALLGLALAGGCTYAYWWSRGSLLLGTMPDFFLSFICAGLIGYAGGMVGGYLAGVSLGRRPDRGRDKTGDL